MGGGVSVWPIQHQRTTNGDKQAHVISVLNFLIFILPITFLSWLYPDYNCATKRHALSYFSTLQDVDTAR